MYVWGDVEFTVTVSENDALKLATEGPNTGDLELAHPTIYIGWFWLTYLS